MEKLPRIEIFETSEEDFEKITCRQCHLAFKSESDLQKHLTPQQSSEIQDLSVEKSTVCKICKKNCATYRGMRQHMGKVHSITKRIKCKNCNKKFKDNYAVKYHRRQVHEKLTQIKCSRCDKILYNQYCFRKHEAVCPGIPQNETLQANQSILFS